MCSVHFGSNSAANLGAKIWNLVCSNIEPFETLEMFKIKIKRWTPVKCTCWLYKTEQVGLAD